MTEFSHLNQDGSLRMVDVSSKAFTRRQARARGFVSMKQELLQKIRGHQIVKGDPLESCRLAGILAAKNAPHMIPLSHPVHLDHIDVQCRLVEEGLELESVVVGEGRTGVEMEALTALAVAALTVYDMCKSVDREMVIGNICLLEKSGGKSGHFLRKREEV